MHLVKSMMYAFATFSRIPVPVMNYDKDDIRWHMCFLPLVGAAIAVAVWLADAVLVTVGAGEIFRAACLTVLPVLMTGGIHMDGYCDTVDALSSYQSKERKLEILKDSNAGAFAVIYAVVWFVLYIGAITQIHESIVLLCVTFVISRAMASVSVVTFTAARKDGMGADEKNKSDKKAVIAASVIMLIVSAAIAVMIQPLYAGAIACGAAVMYFIYRSRVYKEFGGFTGDTAGWFIQNSELMMAVILAVSECIMMQ